MTMKRPGLTPAMRRALDPNDPSPISSAMMKKLADAELMAFERKHLEGFGWRRVWTLTPRGHAALAAEPMTDEQYTALALIEGHGEAVVTHPRVYATLVRNGWVSHRRITPAGRTQLHNIRAAMPGPWVPHSHIDATTAT